MDSAIVAQKLESLRRCVSRVEQRRPDSAAALSADVDAQDILSLNLTRAVQLCVDLAMHWLAERNDAHAPQSMGEAFTALAQAGLIDDALADRLRKAVGFRNVVVHDYETVNWDIVFAIATHQLDDFRKFAGAFAELLK